MSAPSIRQPPLQEPCLKSWGETQIARMLSHYGIRYLYEHPLAVVDQGRTRVWYPDFQLPGYGVVLEYFGRANDPSYAAGMAHKREVYDANGVSALFYMPEVFRGNWPGRILDDIGQMLTTRMKSIELARASTLAGKKFSA